MQFYQQLLKGTGKTFLSPLPSFARVQAACSSHREQADDHHDFFIASRKLILSVEGPDPALCESINKMWHPQPQPYHPVPECTVSLLFTLPSEKPALFSNLTPIFEHYDLVTKTNTVLFHWITLVGGKHGVLDT